MLRLYVSEYVSKSGHFSTSLESDLQGVAKKYSKKFLVSFYVSVEHKKCDISAAVRLISTKFNVIMQNMSLKWLAVKNFIFRIPRWWIPAILKIDKWQYFMMMQKGFLKHIGRPPSCIFKKKLFNRQCSWDTRSTWSSKFVEIGRTVAEISQFFAFFEWNVKIQ